MEAADLSAKICALRASVMASLQAIPDVKDQKALFGIGLMLGKLERDASRIANGLDCVQEK